jgi:hypothetical protein
VTTHARVPVDLGREEAQAAARAELAKPEYQADRPGYIERAVGWALEKLSELFALGGGVSPRGWFLVLLTALLVALVVVAVRRKVRTAGRPGDRRLFVGQVRTAADHRAAADAAAARGAWADAVRERLRAIVRGLEERGLLDARPGRTADEAASEAGLALPSCAEDLRRAARLFDDVWYGGRSATEESDRQLREVDAAVQAARPVPLSVGGSVPR